MAERVTLMAVGIASIIASRVLVSVLDKRRIREWAKQVDSTVGTNESGLMKLIGPIFLSFSAGLITCCLSLGGLTAIVHGAFGVASVEESLVMVVTGWAVASIGALVLWYAIVLIFVRS